VRTSLPLLGHLLIDRQHARLFTTARALHAAVVHGRPARALMTRLLRDTQRHFISEDRLMRLVNYADEAGHRALHEGVLSEMLRMRQILAEGLPLHRKHAAQILDWLEHHTAEADRHLVERLKLRA
jgi:hemerythrin-like metal-binding protein